MIFLSYSWKDDKLADTIDEFFSSSGIIITRDRRDLEYKQSIKDFMKSIRKADYVIMIISPDYLESKNCLYEVFEFIKDVDFNQKIIPIIKEESGIFDPLKKIKIQQYWTDKVDELDAEVKKLEATSAISIVQHLKEYKLIQSEILGFLDIISDMNNIVIKNGNFTDVKFDTISTYLKLDDLNSEKIVVNIRLNKDISLTISDITTAFSSLYTNFQVYFSEDHLATFIFDTYKSAKTIESDILNNYGLRNFDKLFCFLYNEAYYIAGKRKTKEYDSKYVVWWSHFGGGYTKNIKEAGLYSPIQSKEIVQLNKLIKKDQIAINAEYVDSLDLRIIPVDSEYTQRLVEDKTKYIGLPNWDDADGFE
jgi:hypothetical protein